jgi:hypothetical protein
VVGGEEITMFTVFLCKSCGRIFNSEGTPHSACVCGADGTVIERDDGPDHEMVKYCPECNNPIGICNCGYFDE